MSIWGQAEWVRLESGQMWQTAMDAGCERYIATSWYHGEAGVQPECIRGWQPGLAISPGCGPTVSAACPSTWPPTSQVSVSLLLSHIFSNANLRLKANKMNPFPILILFIPATFLWPKLDEPQEITIFYVVVFFQNKFITFLGMSKTVLDCDAVKNLQVPFNSSVFSRMRKEHWESGNLSTIKAILFLHDCDEINFF